ncbi:hypothetical protein B0H10DRAFT_1955937 [Mycena sp. CBHHK59/15]|nr:hypothetical protein B0H10DRAFT_1955937 [Mycena sp. CBHHK59/15]
MHTLTATRGGAGAKFHPPVFRVLQNPPIMAEIYSIAAAHCGTARWHTWGSAAAPADSTVGPKRKYIDDEAPSAHIDPVEGKPGKIVAQDIILLMDEMCLRFTPRRA